jgi:hypothetical protein
VATDNVGHRSSIPATADTETTVSSHAQQNAIEPRDVNGDGEISSLDLLIVFNYLNATSPEQPNVVLPVETPPYRDVSGDDHISAIDALLVINYLNSHSTDSGDSQESQVSAARQAFADEYGALVDDVRVVSIESVTWSNSSLNCPRPGYANAAALVHGYRVSLRLGDVDVVYHTGSHGGAPWVVRFEIETCADVTSISESIHGRDETAIAAIDEVFTDLGF